MSVIKFKAFERNKKLTLKARLEGWYDPTQTATLYKHKTYVYPENTPINVKTLLNIFYKLHYLGSHAPWKIQLKNWKKEEAFLKHHCPSKHYWRWAERYTFWKHI